MKHIKQIKKSHGFTLVELMIGLLISLGVGAVAITYLTTSSRILANQNSEDVIQENVRFAFEIMSSTIRLAGSNVSVNAQTFLEQNEPIFRGAICSGADCNTDNVVNVVNSQQTQATVQSDSIAFSFIANEGTTCTGVPITSEQQVVTQFFVADIDGDAIFSLYCQAFLASQDYVTQNFTGHAAANPAVALVDGVEALQIQYGIDLNVPTDSTVDSYVSYPNIAPANFDDIRSIKIGLLFSNGQADVSLGMTENIVGNITYQILDGTATVDRRVLRQVATTTVFLPNS